MALQQRIHAYLEIIGDGSSTSYSFELRDLFGLEVNTVEGSNAVPFVITNPTAVPAAVTISSTVFGTAPSTGSVSGKTVTLTWGTAPSSGSSNKFQVLFDF